ncbi:MAG: VCBS repeat-containing protein [Acidobacteria bacterium]|nr:VCBS repeat-containing protein [Acidobacteriota bacterium]
MRRFRVAVLSRRAVLLAPIGVTLLGSVLIAAATRHQARAPEFDGDGQPDLAMWRPPLGNVTSGTFYALTSKDNYSTSSVATGSLGVAGDIPIAGDFDGDGKTDIATYTPTGTHAWSIRLSSQGWTSITTFQWGTDGDIPVPADYDGDGKTDIAVYRPTEGRWYVLLSKTGFTSGAYAIWGGLSSIPVPADYDGDGRVDLATVETAEFNGLNTWYILKGGSNFTSAYAIQGMGAPGTTPVPADYDGDGKVDAAVYDRLTSTFTLRLAKDQSDTGSKQWGIAGDIPVPADYDGDGKADLAVFRPTTATYYILQASTTYATSFARPFGFVGRATDLPVLAR